MTEAMVRNKPGIASVKEMPILQDGPPPGGFPPVRFARRIPNTGPSAVAIFLTAFGAFTWGMYQVGKGNKVRRQNEQHCEQEVEDIKQGIKAGNITPNATLVKFSDEALDEQKHAIRIADEKVALAVQAYDLVDAHIQQLDQYLRKFDEELRRERESVGTAGLPAQNLDGNVKSGRGSDSSKGGRKKTRLTAAVSTAVANPTSMDLDLPVDPNEPTYCLCNQVSYGEMVACYNPDCKIEWFHFGCVGLKEQPRGKWYCSDCAGNQKRRKGK